MKELKTTTKKQKKTAFLKFIIKQLRKIIAIFGTCA